MSKENDFVLFKNILIDLISNRDKRPMGKYMPVTIDRDLAPAEMVQKFYCANPNQNRFIVTRFVLYRDQYKIVLEYENIGEETGGGAVVGYDFNDDNEINFARLFNAFEK